MAKFLGVDTGGTFTDFILFDDDSKAIRIHKVLSTPKAPEKAILQGIADMSVTVSQLTMVHGSTVATNAVLEGKGVRTAYITNQGLADVLSIGRQAREYLYDLAPIKKPPLIEPALCIEVNSRMNAQAEHLQKLDEKKLSALMTLLESLAPQAVAINLLFSFFDDSEEKKIEQAIRNNELLENIFISRSSDVLPEYKEFERGMTTTLNAKVGPLMQGYLCRLANKLPGCALSIMQSSGGTTSAKRAGQYPVNLLLSGPAGGLKGAQVVAAASSIKKILSFDMGGTSTDISIIDGEIGFTTGAKVGGYPVAVPMVDMHTIGAGGGSIVQVDAGGLLLVGPASAGADPGPACYGKGGERATVTDANVVLGRLLPESFLGGHMALDKESAITAINVIADTLSTKAAPVSVEQAAAGVIEVVNDHMVRALRVMSVERGEDPKDFTLVSFGGAGGLHVCALAEELDMARALVPVNAGILSALGMLAADASHERSRTINKRLQKCNEKSISRLFSEMVTLATDELQSNAPVSENDKIITTRSIDVRYQGQSNALNLPWSGLHDVADAFHNKHEKNYGHRLDIAIELVNIRARVVEKKQSFVLPEWRTTETLKEDAAVMPTTNGAVVVLNRAGLNVGQQIKGPALITETCSTTWLAPDWVAVVDNVGNLLLEKK
ncbi:MAG: hydantoinase/oxoprolinase family protein [Gammaproteobacteria bacterium]|nr:hydantoinase/oxoprolinase family protein [Gammaproteobacteria bacterium]